MGWKAPKWEEVKAFIKDPYCRLHLRWNRYGQKYYLSSTHGSTNVEYFTTLRINRAQFHKASIYFENEPDRTGKDFSCWKRNIL